MKSREEIISGLEHCGNNPESYGCDSCPYDDTFSGFDLHDCVSALCSDALELLKQQEEIQPVV